MHAAGEFLIDAAWARADSGGPMNSNTQATESAWALVFAAWVVSTASTLGALFLSEVLELPPCVLCWYAASYK